MRSKTLAWIIFFGDVILLYAGVFLTLLIRYQTTPSNELLSNHLIPFTIIYFFWVVSFYINDLYNWRVFRQPRELIAAFSRAQIINAAIAAIAFYFIPVFAITPKTNLFLNLVLTSALLTGWRLILNKILISNRFQERIAIIGITTEATEIIKTIKANHGIGFQIKAVVPLDEKTKKIEGVKLSTLEELNELIKTKQVDAVLTAFDRVEEQISSAQLYQHIFSGVKFIDLPTFYESFFGKIPISLIKQTWFLENIAGTARRDYDLLKRLIDVFVSAPSLLISLFLYPLITIAIKLDGSGSVFYKQQRIGQNGVIFSLIKFRTMKPNSEQNGAQFAVKGDPRITKVGRFLRKTRLDELPQLWNVLFGSMSLVGPRPERPQFVKEFEEKIPYYQVRHLVKPGLSGWAQINYEYAASLEETYKKLQYDIYYIKNRSLLLDLGVILKTINIMVRRAGQ